MNPQPDSSRSLPRRRRVRWVSGLAGVAAVATVGLVPAFAAFTLDGTTANTPGNLQAAGQPSIVLGGLKGVGNARVPWIAQTQPNPGGGARQIFVERHRDLPLRCGHTLSLPK